MGSLALGIKEISASLIIPVQSALQFTISMLIKGGRQHISSSSSSSSSSSFGRGGFGGSGVAFESQLMSSRRRGRWRRFRRVSGWQRTGDDAKGAGSCCGATAGATSDDRRARGAAHSWIG